MVTRARNKRPIARRTTTIYLIDASVSCSRRFRDGDRVQRRRGRTVHAVYGFLSFCSRSSTSARTHLAFASTIVYDPFRTDLSRARPTRAAAGELEQQSPTSSSGRRAGIAGMQTATSRPRPDRQRAPSSGAGLRGVIVTRTRTSRSGRARRQIGTSRAATVTRDACAAHGRADGQIADFRGLIGDAVGNIPGVPGRREDRSACSRISGRSRAARAGRVSAVLRRRGTRRPREIKPTASSRCSRAALAHRDRPAARHEAAALAPRAHNLEALDALLDHCASPAHARSVREYPHARLNRQRGRG